MEPAGITQVVVVVDRGTPLQMQVMVDLEVAVAVALLRMGKVVLMELVAEVR